MILFLLIGRFAKVASHIILLNDLVSNQWMR